MASSAQQMVDAFLGAGARSEVDKLAAAQPTIFKARLADEMDTRRPFSIFVSGDEELAAELASQMSVKAKSLAEASEQELVEEILSIAADAAPDLPVGTAEYALKLFLTHNPAANGLRIPNLMSRMSPSHLEPLSKMKMTDGQEILSEIGGQSTPEEDKIAWFREDPLANEHHEHWHLVYPLIETKDVSVKRRRGEMFFYMHQQMLARYGAERRAAKINPVEAYEDYRTPIEVGYNVGALEINGRKFPPRPDHSSWKDSSLGGGYTIGDHETRRDRFYAALKAGKLHDPAGKEVALNSDSLGNTNECSNASASVPIMGPDGKPTVRAPKTYYGNHHGFGHMLVSEIGMKGEDDWAVMAFAEANIRDPFFWRWHKHIDDLNFGYQNSLPPHDFTDAPPVSFGGGDDQGVVLLQTKSMFDALPLTDGGGYRLLPGDFLNRALGKERFSDDATAGTIPFKLDLGGGEIIDAQIETIAELHSEMRQGTFELFDNEDGGKKFSYPYLWHQPFHYAIRLSNQDDAEQNVTVRLFLCPAGDADGKADDTLLNDRRLWIEMDKFTEKLSPHENRVVVRDDKESTVIRRPAFEPEHVTDLHYPQANDHEDFGFCECGWPYHMLVPRGSVAGMRFALLAIITKDELPDQSPCGSMSFCGVKDEYPDKRPMGYPFDRPLAKPMKELVAETPTMAMRFITIKTAANP